MESETPKLPYLSADLLQTAIIRLLGGSQRPTTGRQPAYALRKNMERVLMVCTVAKIRPCSQLDECWHSFAIPSGNYHWNDTEFRMMRLNI